MSASMYHAIEAIERQLDACAGRVQALEAHVRTEIDQQKEEMHKLRGQLRRALAAISETILTSTDDGTQAEAATPAAAPSDDRATAPEAVTDLLQGAEGFDSPSALVFDNDPDFLDPFASVLPEVSQEEEAISYEAEDVQDDAAEAPADALEAPIAEELSVSEFSVDEPPVAQIGFATETEDVTAEAESIEVGSAETESIATDSVEPESQEADSVEAEAPADSPSWAGPVDPGVLSNFIIPADAFVSEQDDVSPAPAASPVPAPTAERAPDERANEPAPAKPKPLSEFDRLLDWSDFEAEGSDELQDEAPAHAPSGDGMTAVHAPARPTVRQERPVTVSRRVPELLGADSPDQKIGDDLTVISGIDDDTQEALRHIGVISLDEIASWHPADAQRIAAKLGTTSAREIFDVWVPEAQAALFDLFQQRLRNNRFHNLDER